MPPESHDDPALLERRKLDHLTLCAEERVEARERRTLLDDVRLLHDSLPELDSGSIDLSCEYVGRRLRLPLVITGMTGGTARAAEINGVLAEIAEEYGLGFGLGSQRGMLADRALASTWRVRSRAPTTLVLGNIGAVQAVKTPTSGIAELVDEVGANALCVHLNPAQEVIQEHGDRDFRGCLDAIARLCAELPVPVIVKETGCGLSPSVLRRLHGAGVRHVDVSGAGGTTWVGVETLRAHGASRGAGEVLWDWGVPTAASVAWAVREGFQVIASGGIRTGLDACRALALGATCAGAALPWLRAACAGGLPAARQLAEELGATLRALMLLTGSPDLRALRRAPRIIGPELRSWIDAGG